MSTAHPLHGEVLRADTPALRLLRLRLALATGLEAAQHPAPHDLVRAALWRLECGRVDEPERLLAAARAARGFSLDTAERLARQAHETGGSLQATLLLAEILTHSGRGAEAGALTQGLPPESLSPADREAIVYCTAMGQGLMAGEPGRGADVVGGVLAGVPEASDQLRGLYASLLAFDSRLTEALAVSTPLIEDSDVLPLTRTFAGVAAVGAEYWLGHSRRAVSLADAISPIAMTVRAALPYGAASLELIAVCALLDEGELDRARERAERLREQATDDHDPFAGPRAEYCLGRVDLVRGRAATAARRFRRTLAALSPFDQSFRRHISSMLALAAAALGDVATARTTLDACADAPRMKTYEPEFELAVAAILAAELRMGDAADHAAWATGTAADCGQWNIAVAGYHRAACYGAARGILLQMRDAVPRVDGNFAWTLLDHVSAHAARDAAALDEVGRRFEVHGATLLAAQASAEAALAHASDGHPRRARASAVHSAPLRDRCEGAGFPWLAWSEIAAPLTARERQVAVLAAGDQPDAHIAERLGISVRTVQTHLARVYAKLGITSRAQIAAHLDF